MVFIAQVERAVELEINTGPAPAPQQAAAAPAAAAAEEDDVSCDPAVQSCNADVLPQHVTLLAHGAMALQDCIATATGVRSSCTLRSRSRSHHASTCKRPSW